MKYIDVRQSLINQPFFSLETLRLIAPEFNRIQLTRWQQKAYIKPVIRGWYVFADTKIDEDLLQIIANKLISPSYISLEFAFSLYNLIPEGVFQVTSVTSKKTQQFNAEIATFSYRHVKPELMFGYQLHDSISGKICIAELEKAILDFLYLTPKANSTAFFSEMRFNREILLKMDRSKLDRYLRVFNQNALKLRVQELLKYAID